MAGFVRWGLLALATVAAAPSAGSAQELRQVAYQEFPVRIDFDSSSLLRWDLAQDLLRSPAVLGKAVLDAGGRQAGEDTGRFEAILNGVPCFVGAYFEPEPKTAGRSPEAGYSRGGDPFDTSLESSKSSRRTALGKLRVYLETAQADADREALRHSAKPLLDKLGPALVSELSQRLGEYTKRQFEADWKRELGPADAQLRRAREWNDRLTEERAGLRRIGSTLPQDLLVKAIAELRQQEQNLRLDVAGLDARSQALQEQVIRQAKRSEEGNANDEVVQNLRRVVELRRLAEQQLREAHKAARVSFSEVTAAEIELASAEVELSRALQSQRAAGQQQLDGLNAELAKVAVTTAESHGKLKFVQEQLAKYLEEWNVYVGQGQAIRERIDVMATVGARLTTEAEQRLAELENRRDEFREATVELYSATPAQ
jgi:chromosome segregation ATPase